MPASIFSGTRVKILKDILGIGNVSDSPDILTGTQNPTVTATAGNQGSFFMRKGASGGNVYTKQDNGTTTNWTLLSAGGAGLPNHSYIVYDGITDAALNSVGCSAARTATGSYTVTFTTAMSDANYMSLGYCRGDAANNDLTLCEDFSFTKTTTTMGIETTEAGTGNKRNAIWYLEAWEF